ncbi:hypothetical protein PISMIDRAFT_416275 [Pisolithus microcarpus 441]|uniref:Uncharacterized protein n=1 Tax=Pisolithus microcarpus 441 TaxID=765257 RepID=A0A0C9ZEA6_9AGAM|nr:hypothetical protein PISMIDRAFT_416275 [Pisolithus microcarpus 441]
MVRASAGLLQRSISSLHPSCPTCSPVGFQTIPPDWKRHLGGRLGLERDRIMVEIMLCNDLHRDVTSATSSPDIGDVVSRWAHTLRCGHSTFTFVARRNS